MDKRKVYTNYWVSQLYNIKKEHGSYPSEEEALDGIRAWWDIQEETFDINPIRTNTGALEIAYVDDNYVYRIEQREIEGSLPKKSYKLRGRGEIDAKRKALQLDDYTFLFDELAEAYRDRLIVAMADPIIARSFVYNEKGQPIKELA